MELDKQTIESEDRCVVVPNTPNEFQMEFCRETIRTTHNVHMNRSTLYVARDNFRSTADCRKKVQKQKHTSIDGNDANGNFSSSVSSITDHTTLTRLNFGFCVTNFRFSHEFTRVEMAVHRTQNTYASLNGWHGTESSRWFPASVTFTLC